MGDFSFPEDRVNILFPLFPLRTKNSGHFILNKHKDEQWKEEGRVVRELRSRETTGW